MQTVVVTGASTGIGEATALRLARAGWRVFAGVRSEVDAERLDREPGVEPLRLDVTDEAGVRDAVARVAEAVGSAGLDGLVNNAGIALGGPIEHLPLDAWRQQLEVNVVGQVAVTQACIPLLRQARPPGRIVFIGSISGRVSVGMTAPYGASKFAVEAVAESLRHELRPWGIRTIVVEPGAVRTPIWDKARSQADELEASLGPAAVEQYRAQVDGVRKGIEMQASRGVTPDAVAKVVERALTAPRPRARYPVGTDAKAGAVVSRLLPDAARDALMRRLGPV